MGRAYAGAAGTHVVLGLLSISAGVAWLCLLYLYEDLRVKQDDGSKVPIPDVIPVWVTVLFSSKLYCGFWFFVTGAIGCCIRSRGCMEGVYVALNVLNVIIWTPVLFVTMGGLMLIIFFFQALLSDYGVDGDLLSNLFTEYAWLWVFPAFGALVALIEFILSIVSYSIVCCCRPQSLDDGYEYQYEMK